MDAEIRGEPSPKADLMDLLVAAREALLWKVDGASEYDVRRPLTATGTNLLGLLKHLSTVQALYLGIVFDRPLADGPEWMATEMTRGEDLWVRSDESRESVIEMFRRTSAHADQTVSELGLDATADVPWAPFLGIGVSLHRVLVHVIGEAQRHLGHADIVRELIDRSAGKQPDLADLSQFDEDGWARHYAAVDNAARAAST